MVFLFVILVFFTTSQITLATNVQSTVQHVKPVLIHLLCSARLAIQLRGLTFRLKNVTRFLYVILQDTTI